MTNQKDGDRRKTQVKKNDENHNDKTNDVKKNSQQADKERKLHSPQLPSNAIVKEYIRPIDVDSLSQPLIVKSLERILLDITYIPHLCLELDILKLKTIEYSRKLSCLDSRYKYNIVLPQQKQIDGKYQEFSYVLYREFDSKIYHLNIKVKHDPENICLCESEKISPYYYLPYSQLSLKDIEFFYPKETRTSCIHKDTRPISRGTYVSFKNQTIFGIDIIPSQLSEIAINELLNSNNKSLLKSFIRWINNLDQQKILNRISKSFDHNKSLKNFLQKYIFALKLNVKTNSLEPPRKDWFKDETVWISQIKSELNALTNENLNIFLGTSDTIFEGLLKELNEDFMDGKFTDDLISSDQNFNYVNLCSFKSYRFEKVEAFQKLLSNLETNRNLRLVYADSLQCLFKEYHHFDLDEKDQQEVLSIHGITYLKEQLKKIGFKLDFTLEQMEAPLMVRRLECLIREHDFFPLLKGCVCEKICRMLNLDSLSDEIFNFNETIDPMVFEFALLPTSLELYDQKFREFLDSNYMSQSRIEYDFDIGFDQIMLLPDNYIYDLISTENLYADQLTNNIILRTIGAKKFSVKLLDYFSDENGEFWFKSYHGKLRNFLLQIQENVENHCIIFLHKFQKTIIEKFKDYIEYNSNDLMFIFTLYEIFRSFRYVILELYHEFNQNENANSIEKFNCKVLINYLRTGEILSPVDIRNPIGLINIGNTCYLNSLLQFYFSVKPFRDMILACKKNFPSTDDSELHDNLDTRFALRRIGGSLVTRNQIEKGCQLTLRLKRLFNQMIHEYSNEIRPSKELAVLAFHVGDLDFIYGSENIDGCNVGKISFTDSDLSALTAERDVNECILNILNLVSASLDPKSLDYMCEQIDSIKEIFYVKVKQETKLSISENIVTNFEYNSFITLPIKEFNRNLIDSLDDYFEEELIENSTIKTLGIAEPPKILLMHIQRAEFQNGTIVKTLKPLPFPNHIYLDKYMSDKDEDRESKRKMEKEWKKDLYRLRKIVKESKLNELIFKRNMDNSLKYLKHLEMLGLELSDQIDTFETVLSEYFKKIDRCETEISRLENLIDSNFDEDSYKKYKYSLAAIFIHRGTLASTGHYWVYIKDPQNLVYRKYNDDKVSAVSEQEILGLMNSIENKEETPYLLVYVKDEIFGQYIQPLMRKVED